MNYIKYSLPEDLRDELKKPIGFLVNEKKLLKILKNEKYIVSVGDQVTYTLLKYNIQPIICIIDFKIKRNQYSNEIKKKIQSFGKKNIVVKNPPKVITHNLWNVIEDVYNSDLDKLSLRIGINGEEDLAALAAIYLAPNNVTIIYGLPDKGVVLVKANYENKKKVKEILDKM